MRPTIPIGDWRIAVDVAATRTHAATMADPPCGRQCAWCRNWTVAFAAALPAALRQELSRLGLDPARPADLYAYFEPASDTPDLVPTRVTYYASGAVLAGPPVWFEDPRFGATRAYAQPPGAPASLGLSIAPAPDVYADVPAIGGPWLQVDFRLDVPWRLAEPRPPTHRPPTFGRSVGAV
jgi:hypothetical protein